MLTKEQILLALDAPCQRCAGHGKVPIGIPCPACHGTGHLVSQEVRDGVAGLIEIAKCAEELAADWQNIEARVKELMPDCHSVYEVLDEVPRLRAKLAEAERERDNYKAAKQGLNEYIDSLKEMLAESGIERHGLLAVMVKTVRDRLTAAEANVERLLETLVRVRVHVGCEERGDSKLGMALPLIDAAIQSQSAAKEGE